MRLSALGVKGTLWETQSIFFSKNLQNFEEGRKFPIALLGSKPMLQELFDSPGNQPK